MNGYYAIERQEGTYDVYMPNGEFSTTSHRNGISPATVRMAFEVAYAGQPATFQFASGDKIVAVDNPRSVTDLHFWSWVPIFSSRARQLLLSMGVDEFDFVTCVFESRSTERFFMHLPERSSDVVDIDRSEFALTIPMHPPLPHGIRSLVLRPDTGALPSCFRAAIPGHTQVFSELLVSDSVCKEWIKLGLSGALFRKVL